MDINSGITERELERIIHKTNSAKKPLIKYIIIIISITMSGFFEYLTWLNSNTFSLNSFILSSLFFSMVLLILLYIANKSNVVGGLFNVEMAIEKILNDNWNCQFTSLKGINTYIIIHPVFKTLIGLYAYKYGREDDGLALISKAAQELPLINNIIENGSIKDKKKFEKLNNIIQKDLRPDFYINSYKFIVNVMGIIFIIFLIIYFLWHFMGVKHSS